MFLSYFTLFVALSLSAIAAWYSIIGLTAIFAAAVTPIIIMGGALEVAKVTITVWLHEHWNQARWLMKLYLVPAVVVLMIITSMGIFGFLSKAHLDQAVPTGDVAAQVALLDEKIKTQRDNIETARAALKQMDSQVNELLARSADDRGAERAVQIRRQQARERAALQQDIARAQAEIAQLNEQRAPVAAELRKVEAEVGPIKYIAALIYGDNPDANLLERAVRWMIILLVVVFDPLAIMMVLAATESLKWRRNQLAVTAATPVEPAYEKDDGALTDDQIQQLKESAAEPKQEKSILEQHPYLSKPFATFENLQPMVATAEETVAPSLPITDVVEESAVDDLDDDPNDTSIIAQCKRLWKQDHPGMTLKEQRRLVAAGKLDHEPWQDYMDDPRINRESSFGLELPQQGSRGDTFVLTSVTPTALFKHNGSKWIVIDKQFTDQYAYNSEYIDYLISRISAGAYDPDLLSEAEQTQISLRLAQEK